MGRGHADRLVEDKPAVHVALLGFFLLWLARLPVEWGDGSRDLRRSAHHSSFRSRWTAGVRKSFSIRSASSNRSSRRKRMSGANFRLTRCEISPRTYFLFR